MEAPRDPLHAAGEDGEEEPLSSSWLPPDDRLWRHPSEVRVHPAPVVVAPRPGLVGRLRRPFVMLGSLALASGLCGALACAGVLWAAGDLGHRVVNMVGIEGTAPVRPASNEPAVASIADQVAPWVMGLSVTGASGSDSGSGVAVYSGGGTCYVLTDSNLFTEAGTGPQVTMTTYTGATKSGQLALLDPSAGIAVVKMDWAPRSIALVGTAGSVVTGQPVFAVGSPWASVTSQGSYFAAGTLVDQETYVQPDNSSAGLFSMLVANIDIDQSAMGGPLVDSSGNVIGITNPVSGQLQKSGLSYITPIDTAMADVYELVRYGHMTPHAWMGVLEATDLSGQGADQMGLEGAVVVDAVAPGSPLARAGLKTGDIITAIDRSPTSSVGALIVLMALAQPGQVDDVNWLHNGHRRSADVTMVDEPASVGPS